MPLAYEARLNKTCKECKTRCAILYDVWGHGHKTCWTCSKRLSNRQYEKYLYGKICAEEWGELNEPLSEGESNDKPQ